MPCEYYSLIIMTITLQTAAPGEQSTLDLGVAESKDRGVPGFDRLRVCKVFYQSSV
jgi:hypothetical protein